MAERSPVKRAAVSQANKRSSSGSKTQRPKNIEMRSQVKSAPAPTKPQCDDLFAKEEQYLLLNAELEAKTADLVRQAEKLMKAHDEVLSTPLSTLLLSGHEDEGDSRAVKLQQHSNTPEPSVKQVGTKKKVPSKNTTEKQSKEPHCKTPTQKVTFADVLAAGEDSADYFLAKTIQNMEERMNNADIHDNDAPLAEDHVGSGISDAQIRVLKAKLRIMQEELDQLSSEYYKKDDENAKLSAKIKETEEDRARLQKTTSVQQTQMDKYKALAEESAKKCDCLQLQVAGLQKEVENVNRSHKQAAAVHGTVEIRLNRALEESERLKTQLTKIQQTNKDKSNEEHQSRENLLAENKILKKQKAELIVGFKKQLKLIDILKRQTMHFEAAKLLSFTEEEFMKALDWGKF